MSEQMLDFCGYVLCIFVGGVFVALFFTCIVSVIWLPLMAWENRKRRQWREYVEGMELDIELAKATREKPDAPDVHA